MAYSPQIRINRQEGPHMTILQDERAYDTLVVSGKAIRSDNSTAITMLRRCSVKVLLILAEEGQLIAKLLLDKGDDSTIADSLPESTPLPLSTFLQRARPLLQLDGAQMIHQYEQAVAGDLPGILNDLDEFLSEAIVRAVAKDYQRSFIRIDPPGTPEEPIRLEFTILSDFENLGSFVFEISPEKAEAFFGDGTA